MYQLTTKIRPIDVTTVTATPGPNNSARAPRPNIERGKTPIAMLSMPIALPRVSSSANKSTNVACIVANPATPIPATTKLSAEITYVDDKENISNPRSEQKNR